ncbi:MAG: radical SAM protein [Treponema sp.]|jgi:organic radical activating enzyme|nr:radical SAM protein [Treponema sp.]
MAVLSFIKKLWYLLKTYVSPHIIQDTCQYFLLSGKRLTRTFPVEVHLTEHCNLNCKGCSHFSNLAGEEYLDPAAFEKDCERLSQLTKKLYAFKLLGGEPLLHPRITEFTTIARKYFPRTPIQITTNGTLLTRQPEEFWLNCHKNKIKITISQYPIKLDKVEIKRLAKKYKVALELVGTTEKDRMCKMPLDLEGAQNIQTSYKKCIMSWGMCVTLRDGRMYTCCTAAHIRFFNGYFHKNLPVCDKDYVDIYKIKSKKEIIDFLCKPFPFCRFCRSQDTTFGEIWDISKKEITEWV